MQVKVLPITSIYVDEEFNNRDKIEPSSLVELMASIESNGLLQPVIVAPLRDRKDLIEQGYKYFLVAGFRRTKAHELLGRTEILASINEDASDPQQAWIVNLAENFQRTDLTRREEAQCIEKFRRIGLSIDAIAVACKKTYGWVQIRCMLVELPDRVRNDKDIDMITNEEIRDLHTIKITKGVEACEATYYVLIGAKKQGQSISIKPKTTSTGKATVKKRTQSILRAAYSKVNEKYGRLHPATTTLGYAMGDIEEEEFFAILEETDAGGN